MNRVYLHTHALCNECEKKSTSRIIEKDKKILMEKFCPEHGMTYALLSNDVKWFEQSMDYVKPREYPLKNNVEKFLGCPASCGLCPEHQQHTCLPVIEITSDCDMD
ncbi:radical SAM protein, partial [Bacteroidota bacterium]